MTATDTNTLDDAAYFAQLRAAVAQLRGSLPVRHSYQRALLAGDESWSGSSLKGKAARYSSRYAASRASLAERLPDGVEVRLLRAPARGGVIRVQRLLCAQGCDGAWYPL